MGIPLLLKAGQLEETFPRGLRPESILLHLTYGLKLVPFKLIHYSSGTIPGARLTTYL
jgi:hypothetical protein